MEQTWLIQYAGRTVWVGIQPPTEARAVSSLAHEAHDG